MNLWGQVLQKNRSCELQINVDLSSYLSASYLLRVVADANAKIIKEFKRD
jgi:hypothetical protein